MTRRQRLAREAVKATWRWKVPEPPAGTSWWVGVDRETFVAQRAAEAARMDASKFGRLSVSGASCDDRDEGRENVYRAGRKRLLGLAED